MLLLVAGVIAGCGSPTQIAGGLIKSTTIAGAGKTKFQMDNGTHYKVGNKYFIDGRAYYPKEDYNYTEEGIASWYGPNFHAKPTANGGVFDMAQLTAAHRTLPLPSVVRVTNLKNGRSMIVKVNDRGPYAKDRIIDLSKATAQKLGVIKKGTAFVRVEIMPELSKKYKQAMARGHSEPKLDQRVKQVDIASLRKSKVKGLKSGVYIQVGVFGVYENALKVANQVKSYGEKGKTKLYKMKADNGNVIYAVRIGPLNDPNKAKITMNLLLSDGIDAIIKMF